LAPVAQARKSAVLPTVLLWKVQAEAELGQRDAALATGAELRERFPDAPESKLVQSTLDQLQGWATPQVQAPAPTERFGLQVGAFEDRGNALRFRAGLPAALDPVAIQPVASERGPLYRVVVGSFESREAAEAWASSQLQPLGYQWQAVRIEEARAR
jgi:cell division protein FtsN